MSEKVAQRVVKLVMAVQQAIQSADREPADAQRALRELRDEYQGIVATPWDGDE